MKIRFNSFQINGKPSRLLQLLKFRTPFFGSSCDFGSERDKVRRNCSYIRRSLHCLLFRSHVVTTVGHGNLKFLVLIWASECECLKPIRFRFSSFHGRYSGRI